MHASHGVGMAESKVSCNRNIPTCIRSFTGSHTAGTNLYGSRVALCEIAADIPLDAASSARSIDLIASRVSVMRSASRPCPASAPPVVGCSQQSNGRGLETLPNLHDSLHPLHSISRLRSWEGRVVLGLTSAKSEMPVFRGGRPDEVASGEGFDA